MQVTLELMKEGVLKMARPRTEIGTYGVIKTDQLAPAKWRARARYRFQDGRSRQIERVASSEAKATQRLKVALKTIDKEQGGSLKPSTSLRVLGQMFLDSRRDLNRSSGTLETYGYAVNVHIVPSIGSLSVAEATAERLQTFLTGIEKDNGPGAAKNCRSALSGMMGLAVRNDAIQVNPVRSLERINHRKKRASKAVPHEDLQTFLNTVRADERLTELDVPDLIEFMIASGLRVGEACALDISSVNFASKQITVEATAVRVKGQGVVRQTYPKTNKSHRTITIPGTAIALLKRRHAKLNDVTTLLFPTLTMTLRDPSNTQRQIRERREQLGYPELSTHSLRKTTATLLDKAGLSATEIADYLGHENPSMTQDVYMNTVRGGSKAAKALEKQLKHAA